MGEIKILKLSNVASVDDLAYCASTRRSLVTHKRANIIVAFYAGGELGGVVLECKKEIWVFFWIS